MDDSSLVVTAWGKKATDMTFGVESGATTKEGSPAVGSMVSVRYRTEGGKMVATAVAAQPAPKALGASRGSDRRRRANRRGPVRPLRPPRCSCRSFRPSCRLSFFLLSFVLLNSSLGPSFAQSGSRRPVDVRWRIRRPSCRSIKSSVSQFVPDIRLPPVATTAGVGI